MQSEEIRNRFLKFFESRGHAIIPSASLVPENDPSVLFTTAGMQPLVPYLLGEPHPKGNRLADSQKCVRTGDIEEVGDNTHNTFFEMLGNWSLGDYFKKDAIKWSYEFLTSKDEGLGLDTSRLYVTVFEGDENAPRDLESAEMWKSVGVPKSHIYFQGVEDNWWSPGDNGPCGPDTEMFYDVTEEGLGDMTHAEFKKADKSQQVVEVWNDVFMEYEKKNGKIIGKLARKNVDTGAGLERLTIMMQKKDNVFETDLFAPLMSAISEISTKENDRAKRIVADHMRTSVFMISDGVVPSNTDRGYILRRLLRRAVRYADILGMPKGTLPPLALVIVEKYKEVYPGLVENSEKIKEEVSKEVLKFRKTLKNGLKEFEKISTGDISGKDAFLLFSTYGFPLELTLELAIERGVSVDEKGFNKELKKHQDLSRSGAGQKFKGGLADTGEMSVKYHTATHLLNQALREVLGDHVSQKGSNITPERLRFDFSHSEKMTDEEKRKVEDLVNEKIMSALPVSYEDVTIEEARTMGAIGVFDDKYKDQVRVYRVGDKNMGIFSLEICGGPHVKNTDELGHFRIKKEQAVSAGVRRIKAVLE
jgi:alanyl-tRNA synthetase